METTIEGTGVPCGRAWKDRLKVGVVGVACGAMVLGGALAYFTASDTATNWFGVVAGEQPQDPGSPIDPAGPKPSDPEVTGDELSVKVETPQFSALSGEAWLYPGVVVKQDPTVTNSGAQNMDAWAILSVGLPAKADAASAADGVFEPPVPAAGWKELSAPALKDGKIVSVYGFERKLAADEDTGALFAALEYRSDLGFSDVEALPTSLSVDFDAFAIQAAGIPDIDAAFAASGIGA